MRASRMRRFARTSRCAMWWARHPERRGDLARVDTEHGLQHERRPDRLPRSPGGRRRTAAPGDGRRGVRRRVLGRGSPGSGPGAAPQPRCGRAAERYTVAQPVAGHGEQPAVRVARHAVGRPVPQGPLEGLGQGVLGALEVAVDARRAGPAGGRTRCGPPVRSGAHPRLRVAVRSCASTSRSRSGWPTGAPPRRPTGPTAPSAPRRARRRGRARRSTKVPPSCSFVSAKGPSWIRSSPSRTATVVVDEDGCSTSAEISTPAWSSAVGVGVERALALFPAAGAEVVRRQLRVVQQDGVAHGSVLRSVSV